MRKKLKQVPKFKDEAEERDFWESHDTADYFDLSRAQRARFPNLKLSTTSISLRLPLGMLERIKVEANRRDVPYQSLIKVWLNDKLDAEDAARAKRTGRRTAA
jgi:predicted DNA binding CopG/RHH family protein